MTSRAIKDVLRRLCFLAIGGILLNYLGCKTANMAVKPKSMASTVNSSDYERNKPSEFKNSGALSYFALSGGSAITGSTSQPSFAVIAQQIRPLSRNWRSKNRVDIAFDQ
jgi:hypothetical protein